MPSFTANADYEEKDHNPLTLEAGDEITVGPADRVQKLVVISKTEDGKRRTQTVTDVPESMMFFGNTFLLGQTSITYGTVLMIATAGVSLRSCAVKPRPRSSAMPRVEKNSGVTELR